MSDNSYYTTKEDREGRSKWSGDRWRSQILVVASWVLSRSQNLPPAWNPWQDSPIVDPLGKDHQRRVWKEEEEEGVVTRQVNGSSVGDRNNDIINGIKVISESQPWTWGKSGEKTRTKGRHPSQLQVIATRSDTFYQEALFQDLTPPRILTWYSSPESTICLPFSVRGSLSGMLTINNSIAMTHSSSLLQQMRLELQILVVWLATMQELVVGWCAIFLANKNQELATITLRYSSLTTAATLGVVVTTSTSIPSTVQMSKSTRTSFNSSSHPQTPISTHGIGTK